MVIRLDPHFKNQAVSVGRYTVYGLGSNPAIAWSVKSAIKSALGRSIASNTSQFIRPNTRDRNDNLIH